MRPVRISNALPIPLGAPVNWSELTDAHCGGLFVRPEQIDGIGYLRSAWEVEDNEVLALLSGARVILGVSGSSHPVVHFQVADAAEDFLPAMTIRQFVMPEGGRMVRVDAAYPPNGRAWANQEIKTDVADAVASAIRGIEELAKGKGWI